MTDETRIELMGAPGSPYTRKMLALLRYRRIPHATIWGGTGRGPEGYPEPRVRLLPTVYLPDREGRLEAVVDSTPIIRRLEAEHAGRSVIPDDPALRFLDLLIEDYGDEWLTKAMFHYRWAHAADAANAAPLLVHWAMPTMPADEAERAVTGFARRQIDRLHVVGSNETTAATIEASYTRLLRVLDGLIERQGHVLGPRPAASDFALYGQLTQLCVVEPTSAAIAARETPRVRAWIDRMDDLSGLAPGDWLAWDEAGAHLRPLLTEIGRTYAPFLIANARAAMAGAAEMETEIDGRPWRQPTFACQAKCLQTLRTAHAALATPDRERVDALLAATGCDALFEPAGT